MKPATITPDTIITITNLASRSGIPHIIGSSRIGTTAYHVLEDEEVSQFGIWIVRSEGSRRDPLRRAQRFIAGACGSNAPFPPRRDGMSATRLARAVPTGRQCAGKRSSQSQLCKGWAMSCRPCRDVVEYFRRVDKPRQRSPQTRDEPYNSFVRLTSNLSIAALVPSGGMHVSISDFPVGRQ